MRVADDKDHPWPQDCQVTVIVLQGRDSSVVRVRNRIQRLALLDRMMLDGLAIRSSRICGGIGDWLDRRSLARAMTV